MLPKFSVSFFIFVSILFVYCQLVRFLEDTTNLIFLLPEQSYLNKYKNYMRDQKELIKSYMKECPKGLLAKVESL